jgi:hypothetical protein
MELGRAVRGLHIVHERGAKVLCITLKCPFALDVSYVLILVVERAASFAIWRRQYDPL